MQPLGKRPIRSLQSFGVAGVLGDECRVFYNNLFSTRNLGRVTDLLAARLQKATPDELKLRQLLIVAVFEAYRAQIDHVIAQKRAASKTIDDRLDEPMTIECGIDSEKIAVGVSFSLPPGISLKTEGLAQRIAQGEPATPLEELLFQTHAHGDRMIVRFQPSTNRVEIASLLALPGQVDPQQISDSAPPEVVVIPPAPQPAARATAYEELGDLDYEKLLAEDTRLKGGKQRSTSRALADTMSQMADGDTRLTAGRGEGDPETRLDGGSSEDEIKTRFKNTRKKGEGNEAEVESETTEEGETKVTFKGGGSEDDGNREETRFATDKPKKKKSRLRLFRPAAKDEAEEESEDEEIVIESEKKKKEKEQKITFKAEEFEEGDDSDDVSVRKRLRLRGGAPEDVIEEESVQLTAPAATKRARKLVRRLWPFKKKGEAAEEIEVQETAESTGSSSEEAEAAPAPRIKRPKLLKRKKRTLPTGEVIEEEGEESAGSEEASPEGETASADSQDAEAAAPAAVIEKEVDLEGVSEDILEKIEENVSTVDKIQRDAVKIRDEIKDERTKRWVDNLTRDLISEKSNLRETAKRISQSVRQKELEFKNKQVVLEEQVRKSDEALAQKTNALNRTREQLAQVTRSLDRLKTLSQEAADAAAFKQKYALAQKVLQSTKDENTSLLSKIDELRSQINTLQITNKARTTSTADQAVLQSKYDRVAKQVEELKRQNVLLSKQVDDRRTATNSTEVDEVKKKLEQSNRINAVSKKENELLQSRIGKMQKDEKSLKIEIQRLQEALQNAQTLAAVGRARAAAMAGPGSTPGVAGLSNRGARPPGVSSAGNLRNRLPGRGTGGGGTGGTNGGAGGSQGSAA